MSLPTIERHPLTALPTRSSRPGSVSEVLDAAREHLAQVGRCRGLNSDRLGCCCLIGAINAVLTGDPWDDGSTDPATWQLNRGARTAVLDHLHGAGWADDQRLLSDLGADPTQLLTCYNDAPSTSDTDVASLLMHVALKHREALQ